MLAALGSEPTIFVIEDLQWADEATLDLVRYLGRRLQNLPVLVVATYRSDAVAAGPSADRRASVIFRRVPPPRGVQVPPLTPDAVREWVRIAGSPIGAAALHERTSGNPFFISEVLAAGGDTVPAGVRDAVLARAGRLSARRAGRAERRGALRSDLTPDMVLATQRAAGLAAPGTGRMSGRRVSASATVTR